MRSAWAGVDDRSHDQGSIGAVGTFDRTRPGVEEVAGGSTQPRESRQKIEGSLARIRVALDWEEDRVEVGHTQDGQMIERVEHLDLVADQ